MFHLSPERTLTVPAGPTSRRGQLDLGAALQEASAGLDVDGPAILREVLAALPPDAAEPEAGWALVLAARARIERDPAYGRLAARLLLQLLYREVAGQPGLQAMRQAYRAYFPQYVRRGVAAGRLDPRLLAFDLERLAAALVPERDELFPYMGLQILYDRYLIQDQERRRIELPQALWMRVAMGLALLEPEREQRAIEFYELMSTHRYCPSTPTLFNAGTVHPQLSSCYLTTVPDSLEGIFKSIGDHARLSKWAGGLGNDWTRVRALGSPIRGTGGTSKGVIPFLKIDNDTALAVDQGGKRGGAFCAYLEVWHLDIEEFCELRRHTGDERRRTHDMHTAVWVPDLFLERVREDGSWTLFSPLDVPDLHDLYGAAFAQRYRHYERLAQEGAIPLHKRLPARDLWRKILTMLYETGHPWITFKDACNLRNPQAHVGVIHCANLCTEVVLNTSDDEIAVCNLGSVNLAAHLTPDGRLDEERLAATVRTAVRMLDNVIDLNFYPVPEAERASRRHRAVGLGLMGFQDCLYRLGIPFASEAMVAFADACQEFIAYHALLASAHLAAERGPYPTFAGSAWDRGLLPLDTFRALAEARGGSLRVGEWVIEPTGRLDWTPVREAIRRHGLRNSHLLAIAPTATIANIVGVSNATEPTYANLYVKSNLSGEFTVINEYLVADLKALGLWDQEMIDALKYHDGSVQPIARIPAWLKEKYRTAWEISPYWLIAAAAHRQKWIDQSQSLNLYTTTTSGRELSDMYLTAWEAGLKTTYYLRTLGATHVEKSTLDINRFGIQPKWMRSRSASANVRVVRAEGPVCRPGEPECEACQ